MNEPIAIVGLSCRLPGAADPAALWQLLTAGDEAVGAAPGDRDPGVDRGGFLPEVAGFDAGWFGISPLEAAAMDPQQRLALELAWEALEDAGIVPDGAGTAVMLGAMAGDYADLLASAGPAAVTHHTLTGQARAMISGRVAHALGFGGPSLTVDTGQSSSLAAVHLAVQALRAGECDLALAGGVHLMLSPRSALAAERLGALSPTGRCWVLDARADGYVRGEGGGVVVLKRLDDARADGDRVDAVLRGSAMSTGSGAAGLTAPSGAAQESAARRALARGGIEPDAVGYVELHGTGTPAGDPVEARAVAAVYGAQPRERPLAVGSIKANIGHLEGAAGIAGLLKAVLCVRHGELVATPTFSREHPEIRLASLGLRVPVDRERWEPAGLRRAGVSSFGIGGANVHVVIEAAAGAPGPDAAPASGPDARPAPVLLSGPDEAGLRAQAAALHAHMQRAGDLPLGDVAYTTATGRRHLPCRAAVLAPDRGAALAGLRAVADGQDDAGVMRGAAAAGDRPVLVFPGQGAQWAGMAAELLADDPGFAASIGRCERALAPHVDWSLRAVLSGAAPLERVDVVQPALFAMLVALAEGWRAHGVAPWAVLGHSQGEIAAACVAGALSLEDAARVIAVRSRLIAEQLSGQGGMAAVAAAPAELERWTAHDGRVCLAAVNGPRSLLAAGPDDGLDALLAWCEDRGIWARRVDVDYPSHSPAVDRVRQPMTEALAGLAPRAGQVPVWSTVDGGQVAGEVLGGEYWFRGLRQTVRFADAARGLAAAGATAFIEVGPHPVLGVSLRQTLEAAGAGSVPVLGTLERGRGGPAQFARALAAAHVNGVEIDWRAVHAGAGRRRVALPTAAFRRRRHWLGEALPAPGPAPTGLLTRLAGAAAEQRTAIALEAVRGHAAAVLGHDDAAAIDPHRRFKDLGFDSAAAVALRDRLTRAAGAELPTTLAFDHPSCAAVAGLLVTIAVGEDADGRAVPREAGADAPAPPDAIDALDVSALIRLSHDTQVRP